MPLLQSTLVRAVSLATVFATLLIGEAFSFQAVVKPRALQIFTDSTRFMSSDWSDFTALDDDDDLDELNIDTREYAVEEDSQESKAQVGSSLEAPEIENDAPPIQVPAGKFN